MCRPTTPCRRPIILDPIRTPICKDAQLSFLTEWAPANGVIAGGLSLLMPELAAIAAARLVLRELDRLVASRLNFAFETTLSGLTYVRRVKSWQPAGYRVEMVIFCCVRCSWHFGGRRACVPGRA